MERLFLDAHKTLVTAVSEWLITQADTTPGGVRSLAHLLVVIPTRQAGRRLRLALAKMTGGCLPPLLRLPVQLIAPAHPTEQPIASFAETIGLLSHLLNTLNLSVYPNLFPEKGRPREVTFPWALGVARQLADLWNVLQENALTMADVAAQAEGFLSGADLDIEVARWNDLARLEACFFECLKRQNRFPAPLARQQAVAEPMLPEGITRIVLPALVDAQPALYPVLERLEARAAISVLIHATQADGPRFDSWGRPEPSRWQGKEAPVLPLSDRQIILSANSADQSRFAADLFAAIPPDEEYPSLGMADDTLFNELQSAFLSRGIPLHNPAAYPLSASSLGRLIRQLELLRREQKFPVLAAFLREADVMHWLEQCIPCTTEVPYSQLLSALDDLQNAHLPQTLEDACFFCRLESEEASGSRGKWDALLQALEKVRALLEPQGRAHHDHMNAMLQSIFAARTLHEQEPGDRELAAAAEAALAVSETLASDALSNALDDSQKSHLFEALLSSATYQLEPETADALLTDGWLELPWSPAQELVITGFNEGSVPDAVTGHAFLPDRLRQGLGLTSNERRTARDSYLLNALLTARPPGAVTILLERVSSRNDVRKPSRLLFLCDEATLTTRAKRLFRDSENASSSHHRSLPDAWRLALPLPKTAPEQVSVTAFKSYLACPFTFFLRHTLRLEAQDDRAVEIDPPTFGTLCHDALEAFGNSAISGSADAREIAAFLEAEIWRMVRQRFGDRLPAILRLQASAACKRLSFFASRQAELRDEGWQIVATEKSFSMQSFGLMLRGRMDRLDYCADRNMWQILDYKTWDRLGKNGGTDRFSSAGKSDIALAVQRGLSLFQLDGKRRVWTDLQLPLYQHIAQATAIVPADAKVTCGYFNLGETEAETLCKAWSFTDCMDEALSAASWVIDRVRRGIFWPPSPKEEWKREYASLFLESPENSLSQTWITDQASRLAKGGSACEL